MPNRKHKYGNASQVTTHIDSYADGGSVRKKNKPTGSAAKMGYADGGKAKKKKAAKPKKPDPKMLGTGAAAHAGRKLGGRARQIEKALEDAGV